MVTITTWNMKGGTGKTTTAFNLAANYAGQGKNVLSIDLDIQANLTSYFDADIARYKTNRPDISELFARNISVNKGIYHSRFRGVDFVKGSNNPIIAKSINHLSNLLSEVENIYDICFIDCHPDNSFISVNAIAAADLLLIPVLLDGFSRDNLNLVLREIINVENLTGKEIDYKIVVNRLRNLRSQRTIFSDLTQQHDYPLLGTSISDYSGIQSALLLHKPISQHRHKSQANKDYEDLAAELSGILEV